MDKMPLGLSSLWDTRHSGPILCILHPLLGPSSLFSPPIIPTAPFPHSFFALSPCPSSRYLLITTNLITDNHPPAHPPPAPSTPICANPVRASLRTPPDGNTSSSPQHTRHTVASPRHLPPLPLDPPPTPVGSQSRRPSTPPRRPCLASRRRTPCLKLTNKRGRRLLTARPHCERASRAADHLILPLPHPARLPGPSPTAPPPVLTCKSIQTSPSIQHSPLDRSTRRTQAWQAWAGMASSTLTA